MHVQVGPVSIRELGKTPQSEKTASIKSRVELARLVQQERFRRIPSGNCNAHVSGLWLERNTPIEKAARTLLQTAAERLGLSARGYHRVLKVARTIADIDKDDAIRTPHIAEALRYRPVQTRSVTSPQPMRTG